MNYPLNFIPQNLRKPMFYVFLAITIAIFGIFRILDQPLRTAAAPNGIVSFELARTVDASQAMVDSWDANARLFAAFGLGFDFLFMPVYALALSLGLLLAIEDKKNRYAAFAAWMGWGVFAATLFDATENYALWHILIGGAISPYPAIAAWCATFKFTLLIVGLVTALSGRLFSK
jgi:hypothetical protein